MGGLCASDGAGTLACDIRDDGVVSSESCKETGATQPTTPGLSVLVEPHGQAVVLNVAGEIDLATAPQLGDSINAAMEQRPETLVVDLSEVDFLASAGMAVLIGCHQQAQGNLRFRIVATGSATFRPMELTGMTEEISIFHTREEALAAD
jgi:anti-anti-sigma factor